MRGCQPVQGGHGAGEVPPSPQTQADGPWGCQHFLTKHPASCPRLGAHSVTGTVTEGRKQFLLLPGALQHDLCTVTRVLTNLPGKLCSDSLRITGTLLRLRLASGDQAFETRIGTTQAPPGAGRFLTNSVTPPCTADAHDSEDRTLGEGHGLRAARLRPT